MMEELKNIVLASLEQIFTCFVSSWKDFTKKSFFYRVRFPALQKS